MSVDQGVKVFERLAEAVGPGAALKICAFYGQGPCSLYVPESLPKTHRLSNLIGEEAFLWLIASFGGQTIFVPRLSCLDTLRRAGAIAKLTLHGVPASVIADSVNLSERRVKDIADQLRLEGFSGLLDEQNLEKSS